MVVEPSGSRPPHTGGRLAGAALLAFAGLALLAQRAPGFTWDLAVSRAVQRIDAPGFVELMGAVSAYANGWTPHALAAGTVLAFLAARRHAEAAGVVLVAGGGSLLNGAVKRLVCRPRPPETLVRVLHDEAGYSFASGHVVFYVAFFGFLTLLALWRLPRGSALRRLALLLGPALILLVPLSRVALGAHWPSDTLGGLLFAGPWLFVCARLYRRFAA